MKTKSKCDCINGEECKTCRKPEKPKEKYLLMAANGAIEPWVAVAPITEELVAQVKKMLALFQLSESFDMNLSEIAARDCSADYYQPKVPYDGVYEVVTKKPKFKKEYMQRTVCDELIVNEREFWWRCFDKYDDSGGVINTERVKIKALEEEDDTPLEEQAITLTQKLENTLHSIVLSKKTDNVNVAYRGALLIAKGNLEAEIAGVKAEMEDEGRS